MVFFHKYQYAFVDQINEKCIAKITWNHLASLDSDDKSSVVQKGNTLLGVISGPDAHKQSSGPSGSAPDPKDGNIEGGGRMLLLYTEVLEPALLMTNLECQLRKYNETHQHKLNIVPTE